MHSNIPPVVTVIVEHYVVPPSSGNEACLWLVPRKYGIRGNIDDLQNNEVYGDVEFDRLEEKILIHGPDAVMVVELCQSIVVKSLTAIGVQAYAFTLLDD